MSAPRNLRAYERGQALRNEIRVILESRSQLQPPLTARAILKLLECRRPMPSERTVQWHVTQLRLQEELESLDALRRAQF